MSNSNSSDQSNSSSSLPKKTSGKMRRKQGGRGSAKSAPEAPKAKLTTKREFLTLLFPKQKKPGTAKGKQGKGKGHLARRKNNLVTHAAKNAPVPQQQPEKQQNELRVVSQETPLLQTASRRKFIKMAGMTAAAAALWRKAVAMGGGDQGSWSGFSAQGQSGSSMASGNAYFYNNEYTAVHYEFNRENPGVYDIQESDFEARQLPDLAGGSRPLIILAILPGHTLIDENTNKFDLEGNIARYEIEFLVNTASKTKPQGRIDVTPYSSVTNYITDNYHEKLAINIKVWVYYYNMPDGQIAYTIYLRDENDAANGSLNEKIFEGQFSPTEFPP